MKFTYRLGLHDGSTNVQNTPNAAAQRLPFYATVAGHFIAGDTYFTEREGLKNSCLIFHTLSGRGVLNYRGGTWDLLPGHASIINCFEYQYYATASEEPWEFNWVHVGGAAAAEYEERINQGALARAPLAEAEPALDGILRLLREESDRLADVKICGAIAAILTEMAAAGQHDVNEGLSHRNEVEDALAYIRTKYQKIEGIDEIIVRSHLSKFYFLRQFKAYTGMGLYEYLNNHRIGAAKRLLAEDGCKVGNAALAVGFRDVNCFIRYFKKVTGVTPAVYRKYYLY